MILWISSPNLLRSERVAIFQFQIRKVFRLW